MFGMVHCSATWPPCRGSRRRAGRWCGGVGILERVGRLHRHRGRWLDLAGVMPCRSRPRPDQPAAPLADHGDRRAWTARWPRPGRRDTIRFGSCPQGAMMAQGARRSAAARRGKPRAPQNARRQGARIRASPQLPRNHRHVDDDTVADKTPFNGKARSAPWHPAARIGHGRRCR